VVGCASCVGLKDEADFFLAGVCRSKSIIPPVRARPRGVAPGEGPRLDRRDAHCDL
jgi:hypothetical protein